MSRRKVRNRGQLGPRQATPKTFVREKEERLVSDDRSGERSSKIILALSGFWQWRIVRVAVEPIVGVEHIISEVFEDCSVELIGSRTRENGNLTSRGPPEFRCIGGSLNPELLHSVYRYQAVRASQDAKISQR